MEFLQCVCFYPMTAYDVRISYLSSDVCSSDLPMKNTAHDASGTGVKWVKTCVRVAAISSPSRDRTMTRCRLVFMRRAAPGDVRTAAILANWPRQGLSVSSALSWRHEGRT